MRIGLVLVAGVIALLYAPQGMAAGRFDDEEAAQAGLNATSLCKAILHATPGSGAQGNIVCFYDAITRQTADAFLALPIPQGATIVLQSGGGDVDAALDMADRVLEKQATVVVYNVCFSSCANYLFPAGVRKIVLPHSFVGWHGGPSDPSNDPKYPPEVRQVLARIRARSDAFLARLKVSPALIYTAPEGAGFDQAHQETTGWSLPPEKIEALGVHGIVYMWFPRSENSKTVKFEFPKMNK